MKYCFAALLYTTMIFGLSAQTKSTNHYSFQVPNGFTQKSSSRQSTDFTFANSQLQIFILQTFSQTAQERKLKLSAHDFDRKTLQNIYSQADEATMLYHFKKDWVGSVPVIIAYYSNSEWISVCELTAYHSGKVFLFVMRDKSISAKAREDLERNFNRFLQTLKFN